MAHGEGGIEGQGAVTSVEVPWTWRDLALPASLWALLALVAHRIQDVLSPFGPAVGDGGLWYVSRWVPTGRLGGDSDIYLSIAEYGYRPDYGHEAAFPGYALAIRGIVAVTGVDWATAGVAISFASGLVVAVATWRWLIELGIGGRARWVGLALVIAAPGAWVLYGIVYSDALGLAAVSLTLLFAARRRWLLAGVFGALGTFTRLNCLALVPMLVVMVLLDSGALVDQGPPVASRTGWARPSVLWRRARSLRLEPRKLRPAHAGVLVALAGVGSYSVWLWFEQGDPTYFSWLQTNRFGHSPMWHPWAWLKLPVWRPVHGNIEVFHEAASLVLVAGAVASVPTVARRIGGGYAVFLVLVILTSWVGTYNFAPAERYLLPAMPVLAATWAPTLAARPRLAIAVVGASALGCMLIVASFAGAFDLNW